MEYVAEKKQRKAAYRKLKELAKLRGKELPVNPYPKAIKEIQDEAEKYINERFNNPEILEIVKKMKEEHAAQMQERNRGFGSW